VVVLRPSSTRAQHAWDVLARSWEGEFSTASLALETDETGNGIVACLILVSYALCRKCERLDIAPSTVEDSQSTTRAKKALSLSLV
jgi:hypothetical protein